MNLNLKGKTAVVCGSTQGLGYASAVELALLGANIVLMARNEEKLQSTLKELDQSQGQQHQYLVADFSDVNNVIAAINAFVDAGGVAHILVNNTGGPAAGPAINAASNDFVRAFNNHLLCNHELVKALVPGMKESGFGRIINVISTSVKQPIPGLGVSNTIRAAVASWSKTLAGELASFGITVNNVLPGFTNTARAAYVVDNKARATGKSSKEILTALESEIPLGRMGEPHE
ncbi:MAG: SDR family NAD(P)-dependent oxidoreductase, partial [Chitinophagaceae bacterium]